MEEFTASFFIAVGLAMDAFAVSLGIGTTGQAQDRRSRFRLWFHFGFFQSAMLFIGWLAGNTIAKWISSIDHWVALALLAWVGVQMIRSGLNSECESCPPNPSRGKTLLMLCVATSLDAMAVGLGLAMVNTGVFLPTLVTGVITAALSLFGLLAGGKLGETFGKKMEVLGGVLLILIGIRIVISHVFMI